jgi:murein DD-endopeptidase MepM/ murein hydrolase activator NlpD
MKSKLALQLMGLLVLAATALATEVKAQTIPAPPGMGRYCSVTWPTGGWAFESFTDLVADPCADIIQHSDPGYVIQRAGLYSVNGWNDAVARCDGAVWIGKGVGNGPLDFVFNLSLGYSGCVFTVAPNDLPIFNAPFQLGVEYHVTGVDFARWPYNTLNVQDYGQVGSSTATIVDNLGRDKSNDGYIDDHDGHDWILPTGTPIMPMGTPIRAVAAGWVLAARGRDVTHACPYSTPYQNEVFIHHTVSGGSGTLYDEYFVSYYAHFSSLNVVDNQWVNQGDIIGYAGNTGCSSQTHLHMGVFRLTNTADSFVRNLHINYDFSEGQDQNSSYGYQVMIDPYGFRAPAGFDPWSYLAYPWGALSINLWKTGQAPSLGNW